MALVLVFIYAPVAWLVLSSISTRSELLQRAAQLDPRSSPRCKIIWIFCCPARAASEVATHF